MVTLAAGHSLNWFKETFAPTKSFEELLSRVDEIMLDSLGLFFTSYLVGERTPYFDSQIIGIDTRHTLDHFARAVSEGVTFSLKDSQRFVDPNGELKRLVSVVGVVKNRSWLQMKADIFVLPHLLNVLSALSAMVKFLRQTWKLRQSMPSSKIYSQTKVICGGDQGR